MNLLLQLLILIQVRFYVHDQPYLKVCFIIENSVLVSGSRDNKVIFWDTKTGQILKTIMIGRNLV